MKSRGLQPDRRFVRATVLRQIAVITMTDMFDKTERSRIMAAVRSSGTGPENALAAIFRAEHVRVARNVKKLPGSPDFVIAGARIAVFVHGCFWHGHRCRADRKRPKTNAAYWRRKIQRNIRRDARARRELRKLGYSVYTIWACRIKAGWRPARLLSAIEQRLGNGCLSANR